MEPSPFDSSPPRYCEACASASPSACRYACELSVAPDTWLDGTPCFATAARTSAFTSEHGYRVEHDVTFAEIIWPPWITTATRIPPCRLFPDPVNVPSFSPAVASDVDPAPAGAPAAGAPGAVFDAASTSCPDTALVFDRPSAYTVMIAAVLIATIPLGIFPFRDPRIFDNVSGCETAAGAVAARGAFRRTALRLLIPPHAPRSQMPCRQYAPRPHGDSFGDVKDCPAESTRHPSPARPPHTRPTIGFRMMALAFGGPKGRSWDAMNEPTRTDPAERSPMMRLLYRGWRPTLVGRWLNRFWGVWSGLGLPPRIQATLEVRGRTSGHWRSNPVVIAQRDGKSYLVSMLGPKSEWVRNVEAANGDAVLRQGRRRRVHLVLVPPDERAPVLREYVRIATSGRTHFPVAVNAPLPEFEAVADRYPVYRIDPT